jgi:hypothetical protein
MRIVLDLLRSNWVEFEQELTARSILKSSEASWKLLRQWKDGTSTWVSLKDMKESFPVESAEYAVNNKIAEEPSFAWWAHKVPRKRRRVTQKVNKYWKRTHKLGIRLPKSVDEALQIVCRT